MLLGISRQTYVLLDLRYINLSNRRLPNHPGYMNLLFNRYLSRTQLLKGETNSLLETMAIYPSRSPMQAAHIWEEHWQELPSHLPPNTSEYEYSGIADLEKAFSEAYRRFIDDKQSPLVVFTHVPPEEVENHESIPGRIDYYPTHQVLILTMCSFPHEVAAGVFEQLMAVKANEMRVRRILAPRGATDAITPRRRKQADRSWAPFPYFLPPGRSVAWPTVALEVAFSESREQVKRDMGWWLNESHGDVLTAVSIDIKRSSGNIYINTWEQGAMPTRHQPRPESRMRQDIRIYRGTNGQAPSIVPNVALVIPFHDIMLRDPGPGEHDFIFTGEDLLELASSIWQAMDTM